MAQRIGGTRPVFCPPIPAPSRKTSPPPTEDDAAPAPLNAIECFASALRAIETARDKLRGLINSENRHGDLFAALSAARRVQTCIEKLIEHEERT